MSQFMKELLTSKSYTSKQGWQSREFNRDKFHSLVRTMLFVYVQIQMGEGLIICTPLVIIFRNHNFVLIM